MQPLAQRLGLHYSDGVDDQYRATMGPLPDLPLLREGNEDSISNVLYGTIDQLAVRLFVFESASHHEATGLERSCVLLTFEGTVLPDMFIAPRDRLPRLGEELREGGVVMGSSQLMERYAIQAREREHARELVSPELEQWLIGCPIEGLRIELGGGAILGHVPDVPGPDELAQLYDFMRGFHQRIPDRAWRGYRKLS
jgi:hypothetical protein